MGRDELEDYEASIELKLFEEYKAVVGTFTYVVETDRRFYLANEVEKRVVTDGHTPYVELALRDAWVWDLYRQNRFVSEVDVVTFRDVNIERLPTSELKLPDAE